MSVVNKVLNSENILNNKMLTKLFKVFLWCNKFSYLEYVIESNLKRGSKVVMKTQQL